MGYACPVCSAPQADGEHLANHLAFSALLGHEDHEAWLDEHAPEWGDADPASLAEAVVPAAEAVDYPTVFEDTAEGERPVDVDVPTAEHGAGHPAARGPAGPRLDAADRDLGPDELDEEAREILEEAKRLTDRGREDDDG